MSSNDKRYSPEFAALTDGERWRKFVEVHAQMEAEVTVLDKDGRARLTPNGVKLANKLISVGFHIQRPALNEDERRQLAGWLVQATRVIHPVPGPERTFAEKMIMTTYCAFEVNLNCIVQRDMKIAVTQKAKDAAAEFLLHVAELDASRLSVFERSRLQAAVDRAHVVLTV